MSRQSSSTGQVHPAVALALGAIAVAGLVVAIVVSRPNAAPNDPAPSAPTSPLPLLFAVYGDDRLLWKSKEVQTQADRQSCSVDVTGVKVLKLAVHSEGDERGAHGAWVEPRLLRQ